MNKLAFALIIALSSGYAIASDATTWGGDLDGMFEQPSIDTMNSAVRINGPFDIEAAYSALDGEIDHHVFTTDTLSSSQHEMVEPAMTYTGLDGNSDLAGDV